MRLNELIEPDEPDIEHAQALRSTGFWGKQGAGSLFLAKTTCRLGIVHRNNHPDPTWRVEQPGTWGTTGGAIDPGEDPEVAAIREAEEEVGYQKRNDDYLLILDRFQSGSFRYTTFLYVVGDEFEAKLNWEAQGFEWFDYGRWPSPLHFGLERTLDKAECVTLIIAEINKYTTGSTA